MSYKLMQNIREELDKIAEKGLNTGNLETAYKLIDMLKDMENVEYWKCKEGYYNAVLDEMEGGYSQNGEYSERRKRDSRGRYSRDDGMSMTAYDDGSSYARRGEHYVRGIIAVEMVTATLMMLTWTTSSLIATASLRIASGVCCCPGRAHGCANRRAWRSVKGCGLPRRTGDHFAVYRKITKDDVSKGGG